MEFQRFEKDDYLRIPHQPGIYKFFNSGTIIYVGKAKDLRKRVSSYFTKSSTDRKTYRLVNEIEQIEFVIVRSEFDALLLENNLIKESQPKYNILLKDDKSFPSICITKERFPRIYSTRRIDPKMGDYFGPYTNVKAMNSVLDLIRKLNKIRTCKFSLTEKNVEQKKYKVCLEYHIGNCLGPCEGLQKEEEYLLDIENSRSILKGKVGIVKRTYKEAMENAAAEMKFEMAQNFKIKLDLLEKFQSKSTIVSQKLTNIDVFTIIGDEKSAFVNYLKIHEGSITNSETVEVKKKLGEADEDILRFAIFDLRSKYRSTNLEILSNKKVDGWEDLHITLPLIGDKKQLVDLSLRNALFFRKEKKTKPSSQPNQEVLQNLMDVLKLPELPIHIECFDNSNIQGTNPVASMVCFKNGKPSKMNYRKFNIKTVVGADDFGSMKEVVGRRYKHLRNESLPFPQLIVIDGGKGQLNAACDALKELEVYGSVPIIGIAKRLEEIYFPEDEIPIHISKKSHSLKLIQQIRDEAHRFAITFHRQKRSKSSLLSSLDKVKGIGVETKKKLLLEFKSLKRVKEASKTELEEIIGQGKTQVVLQAIKKGDL
ncbi:MAG: excinuclease ABC subunit UvrC [Cyclobacteriaceae bacterium]